jgi:hypothetical protein
LLLTLVGSVTTEASAPPKPVSVEMTAPKDFSNWKSVPSFDSLKTVPVPSGPPAVAVP